MIFLFRGAAYDSTKVRTNEILMIYLMGDVGRLGVAVAVAVSVWSAKFMELAGYNRMLLKFLFMGAASA